MRSVRRRWVDGFMDDKKFIRPGGFTSVFDLKQYPRVMGTYFNYKMKSNYGFSYAAAAVVGYSDGYTSDPRAQAWKDYLKKWKIGGKLPVLLDAVDDHRGLQITATIYVDDVMPGRAGKNQTVTPVTANQSIPSDYPNDSADSFIRGLVRDLYLHELDERIEVNGVRIFDPHNCL